MAITNFAKKYPNLVDEKFALESLSDKVVNKDYTFEGAKTVAIQSVDAVELVNYTRSGSSRYGTPVDLANNIQEVELANDKAFSFVIDALDEDETAGAVQAGTALSRQLREKIIPVVDQCRFAKMVAASGTIKLAAVALTDVNIYDKIIDATAQMDEAEVPVQGRQLIIPALHYKLLKKALGNAVTSLISDEQRQRGVIAEVDGMEVVKVPSSRVPAKFGFMIAHPSACCGPVKLEDFITHKNPPGINGTLCEGRIVYDAFVLNKKAKGIAYQAIL